MRYLIGMIAASFSEFGNRRMFDLTAWPRNLLHTLSDRLLGEHEDGRDFWDGYARVAYAAHLRAQGRKR